MLYDRGDCVADYNANEDLQRYYITPFMDENMVLTDASSGTPSMDLFYAQDGLGTVRQIFDATSSLVNNYDYEGFGTETSTTGALYNRYRYTGREIDEETQTADSTALYYYRARTYDTTIGSFTSRDPIPYNNLYPYCSANPINFTDPYGLEEFKRYDESYVVAMDEVEFLASTKDLCTNSEKELFNLFLNSANQKIKLTARNNSMLSGLLNAAEYLWMEKLDKWPKNIVK